jgi:hypothetical protein
MGTVWSHHRYASTKAGRRMRRVMMRVAMMPPMRLFMSLGWVGLDQRRAKGRVG